MHWQKVWAFEAFTPFKIGLLTVQVTYYSQMSVLTPCMN